MAVCRSLCSAPAAGCFTPACGSRSFIGPPAEDLPEGEVERLLHGDVIPVGHDHPFEFGELAVGGGQVQGFDVEDRFFDRDCQQAPRITFDPCCCQSVNCWEIAVSWSIRASIWRGP